jgi:hypothetical protein
MTAAFLLDKPLLLWHVSRISDKIIIYIYKVDTFRAFIFV